jgi:hypothetical protein
LVSCGCSTATLRSRTTKSRAWSGSSRQRIVAAKRSRVQRRPVGTPTRFAEQPGSVAPRARNGGRSRWLVDLAVRGGDFALHRRRSTTRTCRSWRCCSTASRSTRSRTRCARAHRDVMASAAHRRPPTARTQEPRRRPDHHRSALSAVTARVTARPAQPARRALAVGGSIRPHRRRS